MDLEHNLVGDLGGRELLEALMDRKEGKKLPKLSCISFNRLGSFSLL